MKGKIQANPEAQTASAEFERKLILVLGPPPPEYGSPVIPAETDFTSIRYLQGAVRQVQGALQSADAAPTPDQMKALSTFEAQAKTALAQWQQIVATDLPAFNAKLKGAGMPEIAAGK